jgi:hypothetical protein
MAVPRKTSTRRAVLSYEQLRRLTTQGGFEWPDLLVKDYQGILQDFAFLADETDNLELSLSERITALEYRVYENVSTTISLTAEEFQIILCKNTSNINVTLKLDPIDGDEISVIRTNATVKVIGTINGKTNLTLNRKGSGPKFRYDAADLTWWRI